MPPSPFLIYGPHGYRTFPHSRCQGVPTAEGVNVADIEGDWSLVEYHTSFGGKPFPPHSPYLCPESRVVITPDGAAKMNVSQVLSRSHVATDFNVIAQLHMLLCWFFFGTYGLQKRVGLRRR